MGKLTSLLHELYGWIFDHRGEHHIIPRSRLTESLAKKLQGVNLYPASLWPAESGKHSCWHLLFQNMTPDEVIDRIVEFTDKNGILSEEFFKTQFIVKVKSGKTDSGVKKARIKTEKVRDANDERARKAAWDIVFEGMNGREAIKWIDREFIRKEWLKS